MKYNPRCHIQYFFSLDVIISVWFHFFSFIIFVRNYFFQSAHGVFSYLRETAVHMCSEKFRKIHMRTAVAENLFLIMIQFPPSILISLSVFGFLTFDEILANKAPLDCHIVECFSTINLDSSASDLASKWQSFLHFSAVLILFSTHWTIPTTATT